MVPLPIDPILPEIVGKLRSFRSAVVVAEPGAGKTTRVPPAILAAGLLPQQNPILVILQPRRIAARAAAHRIAEEQGWTLGREVGYHVRFDRQLTSQTRLRVLTEGILTRQLLDDPSLDGIGCVILDEFHERSLHTDLAIALLREVQQSIRPDLLLVVMSATLAAEPLARFLGECPVVRSEGRLFPVEISYRSNSGARLPDRVADATIEALSDSAEGHVLVFLPGAQEIRRTANLVEASAPQSDLEVLPLYGSLPFEEQIRALRPSKKRKLILATNIAETSLTIEGVTTVIDSGLARVAGYDPQRGLDRLELKRISKASAEQRAGRAGRVAPGRCIRLWTQKEQHHLEDFELPEIKRVDLSGTVLALHAWGQSDPCKFGWFQAPSEQMLDAAQQLLVMLGALDETEQRRITPLGKKLLGLPVHPRIARLLVAAAEEGRGEEGALMAAMLEEKDFVIGALHLQHDSDLLARIELLSRRRMEREFDAIALRQIERTRDQLLRIASRIKPLRHTTEHAPLKWPLLAYPDRVARRRANDPLSAVMVGGSGLRLASECTVRSGEFFVALDARLDERSAARESLVRMASRIDVEWLEELFPQSIRRDRTLVYDESRQRVIARGTVWYRDLLLREDRDAPVDPQQAGELLAQALRARAREIVESDESNAAWLARLRFLSDAMPEQKLPVPDDSLFEELIIDACAGKRSLDEVRSLGLVSLLQSRLSYQQRRTLDEHAPESIQVPSGSRIRIDYQSGSKPVLAVRLQEVFGWIETPRIAGSRVPVLLHILGPNFRPVQITDDLQSFWKSTYAQVRKDLRVRYPKHAWPENPINAKPQAKGGRRAR